MRSRLVPALALAVSLPLALTGCQAKPRENADVHPLIEAVVTQSGATHVGTARLDTSGLLSLRVWDGRRVTTWNVGDDATPERVPDSGDLVPEWMVPLDEFDSDALYARAVHIAETSDCRDGGIYWQSLPNGLSYQSLYCDYTTYLEGSATVNDVAIPENLDSRHAEGLDQAFQVAEAAMPNGVGHVAWYTEKADQPEARIEVTAPERYLNAAGEACELTMTLTNSAELTGLGPQEPDPFSCDILVKPDKPTWTPFVPSQYGGEGLEAGYEQALRLARYDTTTAYNIAEVFVNGVGQVVLHMEYDALLDLDLIEIPLIKR